MSSANPKNIDKDLMELEEHLEALLLTVIKLKNEMHKDGSGLRQDWPLLTSEAIGLWWTTKEGEVTNLQERVANKLKEWDRVQE